jgi:flagellin-like hook-associated protein FlgL
MLTQGLSAVNAMVTNNGEVQQQLVNAANEHTDTKNIMQTEFGTLTDANLAEVATKLSGLQTQLSAVYSITAQLRNLTLIQYLS